MAVDPKQGKHDEKFWHQALSGLGPMERGFHKLIKRAPSDPRCKMCHAPFGGIGGRVLKMTGFGPSRKNPRLCNVCFEQAPLGGIETEIGVLFADVRGYTPWAAGQAPEEVARVMNRFYAAAASVLCDHDAIIDKLVGDQVMALLLPGIVGGDVPPALVATSEALLRALGYGSREGAWLPLGIGIDYGVAFVGNVGTNEVKDFTALGDVVNTASRLQGEAAAGQIVMSERVYADVADRHPEARAVELELKGISGMTRARVVDLAGVPAARSA